MTLLSRWKAFVVTILEPWVVILTASTVLLSVALIRQRDAANIAVYTFLVALSSGVLGGILAKRWDDITEEKVIVTRAKSANRSLQLLLGHAIGLEKRVRLYIQRHNASENEDQITPEVVKTYLEEIVENCLRLEEQIIKSIEDWTDIDPTLEIKTVLGQIRELNGKYSDALAQYEQVTTDLQETKDKKDKSEAETKKLKEEKSQIEKALSRIQRELQERSLQVGIPTISGSLITGSSTDSVFPTTANSPEHRFLVVDEDFALPSFITQALKGVGGVGVDHQPISEKKKDIDEKEEGVKPASPAIDK